MDARRVIASGGNLAGGPVIEVAFPNLDRWAAGNTGIPYVWTFGSKRAGPHVLVQALTHGNEVCGAIALDWLLDS
jgi:predicted deacylase